MNQCEATFEGSVESLFSGFLFGGCTVLDDRFRIFDVDVAKMIVPVSVGGSGRLGEFAGG